MNLSQPLQPTVRLDAFVAEHDDTHFLHLHHATPDWLANASAFRRHALRLGTPRHAPALAASSRQHHARLGALNAQHWTAQNQVDRLLANLKDVEAFAAPLLAAAIEAQFGLALDVKTSFVRLYIPVTNPWFGFSTGAKRIWTLSVLDAALRNFESHETATDAFEPDSCFITQPDDREQFEVLADVTRTISISAFIKLCRTLDLGAQYQQHLQQQLGVNQPDVAATLRLHVETSQNAALKSALLYARMNHDIEEDLYRLISGLLDGLHGMRLDGETLCSHRLSLLSSELHGIIVFAPNLNTSERITRLVAYVPNDPEHPIKEYASSAAFAAELTRQLRQNDYQHFFSQFIAHSERGRFFSTLKARLTQIEYFPHQPGDPRPAWREVVVEKPDLQFRAEIIQRSLWQHQFEDALNKILNDGQSLAVPTARVDQQARWAFWDSLMSIATTLLTVAAFVATPFVPFLGELMLGYMAYQFLDETFEGIVEWAQGQRTEAFLHLMDAVESVVQLGLFAAGGMLVAGEFRNLLPQHVVRFIDRFKPVTAPNGKTLYWKPDLAPYEQSISLTKDSLPDPLGLHQIDGKHLLPLDGKVFAVRPEPDSTGFRIDHPTRADAYPPALEHFHSGTWQTELDRPLTWPTDKLLRRIGHTVDNLSPSELEQALASSGYHEDVLRKFHAEREPLPPLLEDTLKRFALDKQIRTFIEQMSSPHAAEFSRAEPITQLQLITEHCPWPEHKSLRLLDPQGQTVWESRRPDLPAIELINPHAGSDDLLADLLAKLDEGEIKTLLREEPGLPPRGFTLRAQALRKTLANIAAERRHSLFEARYRATENITDANSYKLIDTTPGLPASVAREILRTATAKERQQLKQMPVPKRLVQLARWALEDVRAARAFEGLYLDSVNTLDTQRLALHSMQRLTGWQDNLRIDVRDDGIRGTLRDSIGPTDAALRKTLLLVEDGQYQAFDEHDQPLSAALDFYNAALQALPDHARDALGIPIGAGAKLKQVVRDHALPRDELKKVLLLHRDLKPAYDPQIMRLPGGNGSYRQFTPMAPPLEQLAMALNPAFTFEQLQAFLQRMASHPAGALAELSRLTAEFAKLRVDLHTWTARTPTHHPLTGIRFDAEAFAEARNDRRVFKETLQNCWLERTTFNEADPHARTSVSFAHPVIGEFPPLTADFSHVTHLSLEGSHAAQGTDVFLRLFPRLQHLEIRSFNLGQMPQAIEAMPHLQQLILAECGIRLDEVAAQRLSRMTTLGALDLYGNPLGRAPDIAAMSGLTYIDLADTGISHLPNGLLNHPQLRTGIFSNNQISEIPPEFFHYPPETTSGFEFAHNPVSRATRDRIRAHFHQHGQTLGVLSEPVDITRTRQIYSLFNVKEASQFFYRLPGLTEDARLELTRLENEYTTLRSDLDAWTGNIPDINPFTDSQFTAQELAEEQSARDEFKTLVEECWRRESEFDELGEQGETLYELNLLTTIIGDLPALTADFSHVSTLTLISEDGATTGANPFLNNFPKLRTLNIREFSLGEIPQAIFKMGHLTALYLTECNVTLSAQGVAALGEMVNLGLLDLSYNPLGLAPDLRQLTLLTDLILNNTGISELPDGLFQLKDLLKADLSDNHISEMPSDILELPGEIAEAINLRGNPFDAQSQIILRAYFNKHGMDFGIESTIDEAEMEVSTSEGSEIDE
ncbi:dermonecrotic toxin domain-containing protein [Pseudomonas sp. NPDC088885]|uniref:dermonecrotic toxin domain-containing protein n=1 Tax=Pseudomonas sp. NPDC088885 TaxID=3364457 RepID=UPI0038001469